MFNSNKLPKKINKLSKQILSSAKKYHKLSNDNLLSLFSSLNGVINDDGNLISTVAIIVEATQRVHHIEITKEDVMTALSIYHGENATITNESKKLIALILAFVKLFTDKSVHVAFANESESSSCYEFAKPVFDLLEVTSYIVYATAKQLCLNYIKDQTSSSPNNLKLQNIIVFEANELLKDDKAVEFNSIKFNPREYGIQLNALLYYFFSDFSIEKQTENKFNAKDLFYSKHVSIDKSKDLHLNFNFVEGVDFVKNEKGIFFIDKSSGKLMADKKE